MFFAFLPPIFHPFFHVFPSFSGKNVRKLSIFPPSSPVPVRTTFVFRHKKALPIAGRAANPCHQDFRFVTLWRRYFLQGCHVLTAGPILSLWIEEGKGHGFICHLHAQPTVHTASAPHSMHLLLPLVGTCTFSAIAHSTQRSSGRVLLTSERNATPVCPCRAVYGKTSVPTG